MKKNLLNILFFSLIFAQISFSQIITTPAVEWSESFYGGTRGGFISTPIIGPNVLFVANKAQNSISGSESINKFDANGLIKSQNLPTQGGSSGGLTQYACQDGGILVYSIINRWIQKYDGNLNLSWQQTISYTMVNATATLANGFYVYAQSTINNKNVIEIKKLKSDGNVEWTIDLTSFTSNITDIQTTSDDGVIVGTNNGLRKYSASGQLLWNNLSIVNATTFVPLDANTMYIQTQNSSLNSILNIIQLNTQNGSIIWTKNFSSEFINGFAITRDKGCAIMTNTGLYKFNTSGVQEWKNTQYTSSPIVATGDGGIVIIQNNQLVKLTMGNVFNWNKTFDNSFRINIANAPDNGIYVIAQRKSYDTSKPLGFVFKISSPDTPCKMDFDITGSDATFCTSGNLTLGYRIGNTNNTMNPPFYEFGFQWNKNNSPIPSANTSAFVAQSTGKYTLKFTQGTCESTSRTIELKIVTAPVIQADKSTICQGQTVNLSSTGCEGTVVWSNGNRGSNIKITPQITTSYNTYCETSIINASGVSELCKTNLSNTIVINVIPFSNLKIEEIKGKKEFCEAGSTNLDVVTSGGIQPFIYTWNKNNGTAVVSPNGTLKINEEGNYQLLLTDGRGCSVSSETFSVKKASNPVIPNLVVRGFTEICFGSSVMVTTDAKEVNYQWLKNETPIKEAIGQFYKAESSGVYKVQVINSTGCLTTSTQSITINEVVAPVIQADKSNICQGQTVNLSSTGCEGTVIWSNGNRGSNIKITPQLTTSYNAYCETPITNAGGVSELCKTNSSNSIIISVIPFSNLKIEEIKGKKGFCEAGSTTLEVVTSGGIQPFIYSWNKNNGTAAVVSPNGILKINEEGNYQLLLTDGKGCSVSSETFSVKKVSNPVNPTIIAQGLLEFCSGSSVILTTDAKEVNYQWLKNETPIKEAIDQFYKAESSGIYRVQVINSTGCLTTSAQGITINVLVVPQPFIKQSNDTLISSYLNENKWFLNDTQLNENGSKIKFTTTTGNYQVKAVFKGCESELSSVFMPIILANENSISDLSLYPNPVSNSLVISSAQLIKYKFFDILGRVIKEEQNYKTHFDIDVSSLTDGEYLLLLQGINQIKYFRKVVIRK